MPSRSTVSRFALVVAVAALASACAATPPAMRLRARDVAANPPKGITFPLIVEFQEGDVVPVTFVVSGQLVATPDDLPPIKLIAKRRFFVRIDKDGIRTSLDGEHFGKPSAPGSFRAGLGVTKNGVHGTVEVVTPTHDP